MPSTLRLLRSRQAAWAAVAAVMTLIAVLLYANLASPDEPLEHPVPHAYGVHDPQFRRTMDQLLGRPIVPGNRVTATVCGLAPGGHTAAVSAFDAAGGESARSNAISFTLPLRSRGRGQAGPI